MIATPLLQPLARAPRAPSELERIEEQIWDELSDAAAQPGHAWRQMVLATVNLAGLPEARTVVLRDVQVNAREIVFYTDARSPKVDGLRLKPQASFVFWSPELGWQLRVSASCQVETGGLAVLSRWAKLKMTPAAQDYLAPTAPGSRLTSETLSERSTRAHFAVVTAQVQRLDWLELRREGHRRAAFEAGRPPEWLQP
jgi:hypothetical protein